MQKQVEYSDAIKTKYPEQVVIAIARDKNGKANPVTLGWTMIASGKPPMMAIGVAAKHYSVECINHSKCFTIAYPSSEMGEAALFFGSRSGRSVDKLAEFDCETAAATQIDSVLLGELALGRKLGARAAGWGVGLGLLPDADNLIAPLLDDLQEATWHRSLTHSLLFCLAAPPALAWALQRRYLQL